MIGKSAVDDRLAYIDNFFLFTSEDYQTALRDLLSRVAFANGRFKVEGEGLIESVVLGRLVNLEHKTVALDPKFVAKVEVLLEHLNEFVGLATHHQLWKVLGACTWSAQVLHIRMCRYPAFWRWLRRRAKDLALNPGLWELPAAMWPSAREDLEALLQVLLKNEPYHLRKEVEKECQLFVDASKSGLGAVLLRDDERPSFYSRPLRQGEQELDIARLELQAFYEGLRWARARSKSFHVFTDNTNVFSWVTKHVGPSDDVNDLLRAINELDVEFSVEWIPSADNLADEPSRYPLSF